MIYIAFIYIIKVIKLYFASVIEATWVYSNLAGALSLIIDRKLNGVIILLNIRNLILT